MTLKNVPVKQDYNSMFDDVYDDFFNPVLKKSRQYYRVGGMFTSRNFAACAEGLQEFIQNDGKMKLVLLPRFTQEDIESINKGVHNIADVIAECWIRDLSEIKEKFIEDHTKALAWMLAHDNLEIKIVVPTDGDLVGNSDLLHSQAFKRKTGIFWDNDGQSMSFSGDIEFDDKVMGEYYRFRVYRSWDQGEKKYVESDFSEFTKYWEGQEINSEISLRVIPLPEAVRGKLTELAPRSKSEIRLQNPPKLRPYQDDAVKKWAANGKSGIFEMATGTGKTFAGIGCISEAKKSNEKLLVVIACPFDNLERQWKKELGKWDMGSFITSDDSRWDSSIKDGLASLELTEHQDLFVVITTYRTFSSNKFVKLVENCNVPVMLVADEVHNAGSPEYSKGLSDRYDYCLGLSATLERYFDPHGTDKLRKFFGDTVYEMNMAEAIEKGFLTEYYYHIIPASLDEEEYQKYRILTTVIAQLWDSKDPEDLLNLEQARIKRARIIRDAKDKLEKFKEFTKQKSESIKYTLIYCSEKQMPAVKETLNRHGITNREITAKNPSDPSQRPKIINDFGMGLYDAIVANRVLDEGADIPSAKNCMMLASTGNPKQFIQRRGRVLRKFAGTYKDGSKKEHATLYDIFVVPELGSDYTEAEIRTERQILSSQIQRMESMAEIALNSDSCLAQIQELKEKFSI